MPSKSFQILVIEDNEADQHLFEYLFSNCAFPCQLTFASNGIEGHERALASPPDLILMDLNIPKKDGRELIKEFRADKQLCRTPIVMISTSSTDREVSEAYCLGANAFICKQTNLDVFQDMINTLAAFWFKCTLLPTRAGSLQT